QRPWRRRGRRRARRGRRAGCRAWFAGSYSPIRERGRVLPAIALFAARADDVVVEVGVVARRDHVGAAADRAVLDVLHLFAGAAIGIGVDRFAARGALVPGHQRTTRTACSSRMASPPSGKTASPLGRLRRPGMAPTATPCWPSTPA